VRRWKLSEQNFENFTVSGRYSKKTQKVLTKFKYLATLGRHNSAMITDHRKFTTKWSLYGMSSFHFTVRINSKSFPLECTRRTRNVLPNFSHTAHVGDKRQQRTTTTWNYSISIHSFDDHSYGPVNVNRLVVQKSVDGMHGIACSLCVSVRPLQTGIVPTS